MTQKVSLDVLVDSLLEESSRKFEETLGLKWEWEHYLKLYELVSKIQEKEHGRDVKNNPDIVGPVPVAANGHDHDHDDDSDCNGIVAIPESKSETESDEKQKQQREKSFPAFKQWLEKNGVNFEKVDFKYFGESGYGLQVKKHLKKGEVVFDVPQQIILTSSKARDSKLKLLAEKDPILRSMQNVAIAMYLLYEKYGNSKDSFWAPYIAVLPSFYDTVLYFTKDEMSLLKYSPSAFREALKMYRNVARQYAYFHIKFKKANDPTSRVLRKILTYNRYIWAVSSVTTRINHLPNPDNPEGEEIMSMIPLWDLCNHEENIGQVTTDYDDTTQRLTCYSAQDFGKGAEFKIYYGHRSSNEYLVHNGFVPEGYRDDPYYLELGVGINDVSYMRKKAVLGHVGLMCQNIFLVKPDRMLSSKGLFMFVRIFLADKDAMETIESNADQLSYLNEPTEQSLKFLVARFTLLKRSVENSKSNVSKAILEPSEEKLTSFARRASLILQLLKNEEKILEMLILSTNNLLNTLNAK